ncbi:MAG TPA: TetR/AcrR family transcriptional regulator [Steroidobacteraceae bacterium]
MHVKARRTASGRRSGRDTAQHILDSARELLMRAGDAQFSMRNVAAQAGLHLANVQYYYPTRDALMRAILADTGARYRAAYERLRATHSENRVQRFRAVVDFNLRDIADRRTRRFFIQLWALLNTLDGETGNLHNELYQIDIAQLSECIAELVPQASAAEVRRRATLLAAMIEGLVLVRGAHSRKASELKQLMAQARALGMQIALGLAGDIN